MKKMGGGGGGGGLKEYGEMDGSPGLGVIFDTISIKAC